MSKKDLIDAVAEATELTKDKAGVAVEAVIKHIETTMKKGEEVRIPGFGTFKVDQAQGPQGAQPADRRGDDAEGRAGAQVPGVQEFEGHAELRRCFSLLIRFPGRAHCQEARPFAWRAVGDRQPIAATGSLDDCRLPTAYCLQRAVSSAVERFVYTEDVGGSIPSPPTILALAAAPVRRRRARA